MTTEMDTTATERVLAVLDGVRPSGDGWKALCPAHDDHNPSLGITPTDDRVLLNCYAGCEYAAVLAAAGLRASDLFDHPRTGGGGGMQIGPDGEPEWFPPGFTYQDYYNYVTPDGAFVFQALRGIGGEGIKKFLQRRPDRGKRSGWSWETKNLPEIERAIPYYLPELIAAVAAGETIWITEGEKDAEALDEIGVRTTCNAGGAGKWTPLHAAYLKGAASVVVVADKDGPGYKHATFVATTLRDVGVTDIRIVEAAATVTGKGADAADHLAAGFGLDDFVDVQPAAAESTDEKAEPPDPADGGENRWYEATDAGLVLVQRHKGEGSNTYTTRTRLTNFAAVITASTEVDDGVEIERVLEIEATVAGRVRHCSIPASAYARMEWVVPELDPAAIVLPQCKDLTRAAIQTLSDPAETRQYAQTGWRKVDGQEVYLHAGGALGAAGAIADVRVDLAGSLAGYQLPAPGGVEAVRASLRVLDCAPEEITIPLLAAVYRAPLGKTDSALSLFGSTGLGKSELAALAQQHYGAGLDARNLPASWTSTANALEETAFLAADALLVIDDFCPTGSPNDVNRLHATADRVIRNAANGAARGRSNRDSKLRPPRPPRALIVSTGEVQVRAESLRARTLPIHLKAGQVNWTELRASQSDAAAGLFAGALAGYLAWLAGRMDAVCVARVTRVEELRGLCAQGQHKRTAAGVASFLWGWEMFLGYAEDTGAVTSEQADALWVRGWEAMERATAEASAGVGEADPAARFLTLLRSAIGSGGAHVAGLGGAAPTEDHRHWGWRGEAPKWAAPMGQRVGWVEGDDLYLDSDAAYRAARAAGEGLVVDIEALRQRLREAGLLASVDEGRTPTLLTVRKQVEGKQRRVLHLHSDALSEGDYQGDYQGDYRVTTGDWGLVTCSHPRVTWVTTAKSVSDQVIQSVIVGKSPQSPKTHQETWRPHLMPDMGVMPDAKGHTVPETPAVSPSRVLRCVSGDQGDYGISGASGDPGEGPRVRSGTSPASPADVMPRCPLCGYVLSPAATVCKWCVRGLRRPSSGRRS